MAVRVSDFDSQQLDKEELFIEDDDEELFLDEEPSSPQHSNDSNQQPPDTQILEQLLQELDDEETPLYDEQGYLSKAVKKEKNRHQMSDKDLLEDLLEGDGIDLGDEKEPFSSSEDSNIEVDDIFGGPIDKGQSVDLDDEKSEIYSRAKKIIQHKILNGDLGNDISDSFVSSRVGKPTVIRVCEKYIALGTSKGLILLYHRRKKESQQSSSPREEDEEHYCKRATILGGLREDKKPNPSVTSLDFGPGDDYRLLLAGYSNGDVIIWNPETSDLVKHIVSEFEDAIRFVLFLHDHNSFLVVDERGTLKWIRLRKVLFSVYIDSDIIALDTQEKITDISVLPRGECSHPTNDFTLVAIATEKKVMVYQFDSVATQIRVIEGESSATPCIAWKRVMVPNGEYNSLDNITSNCVVPYLAVGWGENDSYHVVVYSISKGLLDGNLKMEEIATIEMPHQVKGLVWLSVQVIAVWDSEGEIRIVDPLALKVVETINLKKHELYSFHAFKDNWLHKSKYGPTIIVKQPSVTMYLLGSKGIHTITVKSWDARIKALVDPVGLYADALNFAIELYRGCGDAVIGLTEDPKARQKIVANTISDLLFAYFKHEIETNVRDDITTVFKNAGETCINYCLQISNYDIFMQVYNKFVEKGQQSTFFDILVQFILQDRMNFMPDQNLFGDFVKYFAGRQEFEKLEQCLLHLDLTKNIDYKFLLTEGFLTRQNMLKAYLYFYNAVKDEYIPPLENLQKSMDYSRETGYILLEYMHNIFMGRSYSSVHQVPDERVKQIKKELLSYIFRKETKQKERYVNLEKFLKFDSKEFFKVLLAAYHDKNPTSPFYDEMIKKKNQSKYAKRPRSRSISQVGEGEEEPLTRKRIQEILIDLMVNLKSRFPFRVDSKNPSWSVEQLIHFYAFLAECGYHNFFPLNVDLIHRIFAHLTHDSECDAQTRDHRQTHLVGILRSYQNQPLDEAQILELCTREDVQFYKVAVHLYKKQKNYSKIIECHLKDNTLKSKVFTYINELYNQNIQEMKSAQNVNQGIYQEVRAAIMSHLLDLMRLNPQKTSELIIKYFEEEHKNVLKKLSEQDRETGTLRYKELLYHYLGNIIIAADTKKKSLQLDNDLQFTYIQLLCEFNPQAVYGYLTTHETSNLEGLLKVCEQYNITDAISFLYERKGEVSSALKFIREKLDSKLVDLTRKLVEEAKNIDPQNNKYDKHEWLKKLHNLPKIREVPVEELEESKQVEEKLRIALGMCKRNTARKTLDEKDVRQLWYTLMDKFIIPRRQLYYFFIGKQGKTKKNPRAIGEILKTKAVWESMLDTEKKELQALEEEFISGQRTLQEYNEEKQDKISSIKEYEKLIKETEEKARALEQEEEQQLELAAPKDVPKLTNLWLQRVYIYYIDVILGQMIGSVPIPIIIKKLVREYADDEFKLIRNTILKLQARYDYDHKLMITANNILEADNYNLGKEYKHKMAKGLRPVEFECPICGHVLNKKYGDEIYIRLFECGHAFHHHCIRDMGACPNCVKNVDEKNKKKHVHLVLNKPTQILSVDTKIERMKTVEKLLASKSKMYLYKDLRIEGGRMRPESENSLKFAEGLLLYPKDRKEENPNKGKERKPSDDPEYIERMKAPTNQDSIFGTARYPDVTSLEQLLE